MFLHGSQNKENKKNKIIFVSIYIMPTKLYKIIGEDGEELHGIERKKELDKRLREKKKEEKKKKKKEIVEEDKTEEEKEEEESILEYPTIEQPHIDINSDHDDEIVVSEEEIQNYIREKEQKKRSNPVDTDTNTTTSGIDIQHDIDGGNINIDNNISPDRNIDGYAKIFTDICNRIKSTKTYKFIEWYAEKRIQTIHYVHATKLNIYYISWLIIINLCIFTLIQFKILYNYYI